LETFSFSNHGDGSRDGEYRAGPAGYGDGTRENDGEYWR
jgi:hypothetical protein